MKNILTVSGIRPDFIRMSEVFRKLDESPEINHTLIHTGQHFDRMLSDVFFEELKIRSPDFNLEIGGPRLEHFHQNAELTVKLIELIRNEDLKPDLILFLGDSNSVLVAPSLVKEGYKIGHIEAGMRSYDRRMLEEINRVVCDHCSDFLFVYHDNYKQKALREGISSDNIFVVGNTIVEVVSKLNYTDRDRKQIILDIHRPENFKYKDRMRSILHFTNKISNHFQLPVKMLGFTRTLDAIDRYGLDLGSIQVVDLMSFMTYTRAVYDSQFIISDSGTAQEEPALLGTPVIVPRDYTERPESVENNCSIMYNLRNDNYEQVISWLLNESKNMLTTWLGDGSTSSMIVDILENRL